MMTRISIIAVSAVLIATLLGGTGCRKSDIEAKTSITENLPATIMVTIDKAGFASVATRSEATENKILSVALFVFDGQGKLVTRSMVQNVTTEKISLNTFSGNNMRVVAVANYTTIEGLEAKLTDVANYDVLTDVVITQTAVAPQDCAAILMTGQTTADISDSPHKTPLSIALQYAVAKVTLNVKVNSAALGAGESLDISNIALGAIATEGYVLLRSNEPTDRHYAKSSSIVYTGNQTDGLVATFYILENLRGGRIEMAPEPGMVENSTNGHLFKRHFAPQNASYAVISANHRKPGSRARRVDYYIYFGQNNSNDYNIGRGENHTYNIRINGLNNVDVDTNVETTNYRFELTYGDNFNFDAHPDSRTIRASKADGMLEMEVIDNNGRRCSDAGFDATWVKLSPLDLLKHQVRTPNADFQQMGDRYSIVRGKYIPHQSQRAKLPAGGWNNVPIEHQNDDQLSYANATFRMCYAITEISLSENREITIYADENLTGAERSAKITVRYIDASRTEQVEILPITQAPLYVVGEADGYQMLVESYEEYSFNIYAQPSGQLRAMGAMQWGFDKARLMSNETTGEMQTANAVYGNQNDSWHEANNDFVQLDAHNRPHWESTIAYRTKYGAAGLTHPWDTYYGQPVAPYYYPLYDAPHSVYSPIYNSAAARYCHEKNRDLNGDGLISPDETLWYLPSASQYQIIAQHIDRLPSSAQFNTSRGTLYWSSTEGQGWTAYAYDLGQKEAVRTKKNSPKRVRCIRRGEKVAAQEVFVDANNSIVVDNSALGSEAITATPKPLICASQTSDQTIGSRFIVAKKDAATHSSWTNAAGMSDVYLPMQLGDNLWSDKASGCAIYTELPDKSDTGHWRLPTKGELNRIATLLPKLNATGAMTPMTDNWYWSATEIAHQYYFNSWAINVHSGANQDFARSTTASARCIKQI